MGLFLEILYGFSLQKFRRNTGDIVKMLPFNDIKKLFCKQFTLFFRMAGNAGKRRVNIPPPVTAVKAQN